jgi:ActR/RegA family two-component response regulator
LVGQWPATAVVEAARAGVYALLPKPVTASHVLAVLRRQGRRLPPNCRLPSLDSVEREYLQAVLVLCGGSRSEAARRLGIHRSVLQRKLARLAI